jgi:hypothetical protein
LLELLESDNRATGGAGFMAAAGVATSVTGGIASLGMSTVIYWTMTYLLEMWKNAAIRGGLEA